jgi:hypothetical protein
MKIESASATWLALVSIVSLTGCSKLSSPFSNAPRWTTQSFGASSVEMPGQPETVDASDGAVARVKAREGDYVFARLEFPVGVLEVSQNQLFVKEAIDKTLLRDVSVTTGSETQQRIEAGAPGVTWLARDIEFRTADGRPCELRQVFVKQSLLLLSVCRAKDDAAYANWYRMRDSLKIYDDPSTADAAGNSADFVAYSPSGNAVLRQKSTAGGLCALSCEVDGGTKWSAAAACMGTKADLHFVADDCERNVTFRRSALRPGESSDGTPFIFVNSREKPDYQVVGGALRPADKISRISHPISGLGSNNGALPKYSADGGGVSFETLDHRPQAVSLYAQKKAKNAPAR